MSQQFNKYNHTPLEMVAMVLITTFTNGFMINNLFLAIRQKKPHVIFLVALVLLSSFMYHLCDSIGMDIYLDEYQWHQLDNIGSICGFIEIFIYFTQMDIEQSLRNSWIYFIFVTIIQEEYTWKLWATVLPIVLSFVQFLIYEFVYTPQKKKRQINKLFLRKGLLALTLAILAFYMGLDEFNDYLRFWHGLWHFLISYSFFHLYQIYEIEAYSYMKLWQRDRLYIKL